MKNRNGAGGDENDGKRPGDTGLARETDRLGPALPCLVPGGAHNLPRAEKEVVMSMLSMAKRARTEPPVRMEFRRVPFGTTGASFLKVFHSEYERPNSGGPERALVIGPLKFSTDKQVDRWTKCANREIANEDTIVNVMDAVEKVAYPHSIQSEDWESALTRSNITSITVRNPTNKERGGVEEWGSLWVVEFKRREGGRSVTVAMFYLFFGVLYQDMSGVKRFLADWKRKCPGADLRVVEEAFKQVPVPAAVSVRSMDGVNQDLNGLVLPDLPTVSAGRRAFKYITSFFGF